MKKRLFNSQDLLQLDLQKQNLRGAWHENHLLLPYTSWRVGGEAQYFYRPHNLKELQHFLAILPKEIPITWLGAATNVLIRDRGIKGVVIYVRGCLNELQKLQKPDIDGRAALLRIEAGVSCSRLVQCGAKLGMVELMFLAGIPGTFGGALAMNAGAYEDEIWRYVVAVETIDRFGEVKTRSKDAFQAEYRGVKGLNDDEWFVAGYIKCKGAKVKSGKHINLAKERVKELLSKRRATQPIREFSCGSVFRNPEGDYAARLIEASGLKGVRVGGAKVSEKHANFIVNEGGAAAKDIEDLIMHVADIVEKKHGVKLECEVKILGEG